ncbi:ricin B lectin domain-containing protein [Mycena sanguinolenta]|nr:ricin B lectin domain-containing protein [Mycena sanguinolenta]
MFSPTFVGLLTLLLSAAAQPQQWDPEKVIVGPIFSGDDTPDSYFCISAESNQDGAAVAIVPCNDVSVNPTFPDGNTTWSVPNAPLTGSISTFSGQKCLDVPNGNAVNGQTLQIWTCTPGNTNQVFLGEVGDQIQWVGTDFCVDLTGGDTTPGNRIQIWECAVPSNSNPNQEWVF